LKLDQITNDLLPDLVIFLWGNKFKSFLWKESHQRSHSCWVVPLHTKVVE